MSEIDVSSVPLFTQQAGDQLIAVRDGAIVRVTVSAQSLPALVATTGQYGDLLGLPDLSLAGLGAAAAAQGLLAETAVQPSALLNFETTAQLNARDAINRARGNHTGSQLASTISDFAAAAATAAPVQSVAGKTGIVTLSKPDVGLGDVDNTSDLAKPISTAAQAALDLKASVASLAAVATSGQYSALLGIPSTFTPSSHNQPWSTITNTPTTLAGYGIVDAATAVQGARADTAVQPAAIASFETTTQLNARDTANRARGNHTGTQPASTITGLTHGFTYDQQAEPSGPAIGQTWRERSAGGLIVGEWEWTGSVWAALQKTTMSSVVANGAATAYPTLYFEAPRCLFVQCRVVINPVGNPATPFNSSNYREVYLARGATGAAASVFGFRPLLSLAQGEYSSPMSYLNPSGAPFFTQTAVAGSPGTMNAPGVSWVYREVRA